MSEKTKTDDIVGAVGPNSDKGPEEKGKATDPMEEKVPFIAPIDPTGKQTDIILSVNGETIRVRRGFTVEIKRKFLEVWENSQAQQFAASQAMEAAANGGQAPILAM